MRLPTTSRPDEVSFWIKARSYNPRNIPHVPDVTAYSDGWKKWWMSCQPAWRQDKGWPLPRENTSAANWAIKAGARGRNGLFLVILSTAWWASSVQSTKDWAEFDEAVDDVQWVIEQAIDASKGLPAPASLVPPNAVQPPDPAPAQTWMARSEGKRQARPSRRMIEGGGLRG